ncbi:MAG TPA: NADH-quinone oxidoreductase subunit J [Candidatus Thermoplasmatota archaeon]|nr:NADH-quinone oxidoreductase subunit J [Candidatus Thermoplasmatota archaeon]
MQRRTQLLGAFLVAAAIFWVMDSTIRETDAWDGAGEATPPGLDPIVFGLFDKHVIALEVLGVLLTAAMIGALVIARPLTGRPDRENYPAIDATMAAQSEAASAVATHFPEEKA